VGASAVSRLRPVHDGKLPIIPFCRRDDAEVEIAAAGNVRMGDNTPGID
jgi:hypothetical protein